MLERLDLLTKELTILAKEDTEGFQRIITGLEDLTIYGQNPGYCGYGKYYQGDWSKSSERADAMKKTLRVVGLTPMEDTLWTCFPDQPLDEQQEELLTLCKEIQKEMSHAV